LATDTFNGNGFPDATNTGVKAGVNLVVHNGDLVINTPGAVISGLDIKGTVYINAPNVTLENCKVTSSGYWCVNVKTGVTGTVVQDCTIDGTGTGEAGQHAIAGAGTFLRNNIFNAKDAINVEGSNTIIADNYIHDMQTSDPGTHYDGIMVNGGFNNVLVSHNTMIGRDTSCVFISNDFGPMDNIVVDNNLLLGQNDAAYTIYVAEKAGNPAQITNVQVTNNVFGKGYYGFASVERTEPVWSNNIDYATGKLVLASGALSSAPPVVQPPAAGIPAITSFSTDSGIKGDGITNDSTLQLKGTATANSTIKVYDNGVQIGSTTADSSGSWGYITDVLTNAKHVLTATATSSSGQASAASGAVTVTVDTVAPTAPALGGNTIVNTNQVKLSGTAEANSTVTVYDGSAVVGTGTANSAGAWSITTNSLSTGTHTLTAKAADVAGNVSTVSQSISTAISGSSPPDTVAPTAPVVSSNTLVNTNQVKLSGTAEANSTVTVYDGNAVVGTGTTNSTGTWSITTNALSTGTHTLTAKAADLAGNVSTASQSVSSAISATSPAPTPATQIETQGATDLTHASDHYFLRDSAGSGPSLKFGGAAFVDGQFGGWAPIGAEKTATGYQVAWKDASTGLYTAWNTDNNGNYVSNVSGLTGYVSGTNSALKSLETSLHQDLNGDGQIGLVTTAVETQGATDLTHAGDRYLLRDSAGSGPSLKFGGADFVDGQFGGWAPIGAEKTATGYQVAWKDASTGQYTAWNTDNNGNYLSNVSGLTGYVSGTNFALKSFETSLQQDLNGDGQIGLVTTAVETQGATDLTYASDHYLLRDSAGSGPSLKFGGADFVDGQFGGWAPIGAEKTATGYQVAWKDASTGLYTAWNTDNNGNYVSNVNGLTGYVSGTNSALKSFETSLQQDLNGDGQIGASSSAPPISSVGLTTMYKNWSDIVTIKGTADANSQIKLYDGNTSLGTVTTAADGTWSYKTSSAVSDTVHTYTAQQLDGSGQAVGTSGSAILGSTGSNTLKSTSGNDILVGGGQADTFVFAANFGRDIIKDFVSSGSAQDMIQFSKTTFDSFASVLSHASQVDQDVVISSGSDTLTLKNTKLSSLNSGDFHFA
jgi:hypothetical protein